MRLGVGKSGRGVSTCSLMYTAVGIRHAIVIEDDDDDDDDAVPMAAR